MCLFQALHVLLGRASLAGEEAGAVRRGWEQLFHVLLSPSLPWLPLLSSLLALFLH